jgi:hypothetical protein
MQSTTQSAAREFVWKLLQSHIESIISKAQEQKYAHEVAEALWANPAPTDLLRLDGAESTYLLRPNGVSDDLKPCIIKALGEQVDPESAEAKSNKELRGAGLKKTCESVVTRNWDNVRRNLDDLFEKRGRDCFADRLKVRGLVIQEINDRCCDCLLDASVNEADKKLRVKALAILSSPVSDPIGRQRLLSGLKCGRTSELPFVPKYLAKGKPLRIPRPPVTTHTEPDEVFTADVLTLFPEATPVKLCVERYLSRDGTMSIFSPTNRPVTPGSWKEFESLPNELPTQGGIIVPKQIHLHAHREDFNRTPDGIISLVGMSVLLESFLRQILQVLGGPINPNHRGWKLIEEVGKLIALSAETQSLLTWVFGTRDTEGRRDSFAHAAFCVDDRVLLDNELKSLLRAFKKLREDLGALNDAKVFSSPLWNKAHAIDANDLAFFDEQRSKLYLLYQPEVEQTRRTVFQVVDRLIPDKFFINGPVILFWVNLDGPNGRLRGDHGAEFAGIVGAMMVFEELLRASAELKGEAILNVSTQQFCENGDSYAGLKCELAILHENPGQLLCPDLMQKLFPQQWAIAEFRQSVDLIRSVRDRVLHGGWHLLPPPRERFLHLMIKLIFGCCEEIAPVAIPDTLKRGPAATA